MYLLLTLKKRNFFGPTCTCTVIIIISTKIKIKSLSFQYLSHRPNLDPEMPFYLGVNRLNNARSWYKNQPLGEKTLRFLMQKAVKKSNIEKNPEN